MSEIILETASSLDLEIHGAIGQFAVKPSGNGTGSIAVRYVQTHLTFALEISHQQRFFETLAPVREIFKPQDLGFEDLMQRDIDDARVSNSLIPYLVTLHTGDSVKFFPPIVAVVIPVDPEGHLLPYYPDIQSETIVEKTHKIVRMRSGKPGEETFEFEQFEIGGKLQEFDYAKLRVNTNKCRLVIVDGQHRAMALLALYRNIKGWEGDTQRYENYYKRWSKKSLEGLNLREISLPIVVCTFPILTESNHSSTTVTKASRSVFLALNKNARPVTTSRNILLDDYDLIAHFERHILESVKQQDPNSTTALRLWNFELDAEEDKTVLSSTVALSGVMHLPFLLERALFLGFAPTSLYLPSQKFGNIKNLEELYRRLDGRNLLGEEVAENTTRRAFSTEALEILVESFGTRYRELILQGFETFAPYDCMCKAALDLEVELRMNVHDMQCHSMLFEGQGHLRVFETYLEQLESDLAERYPSGEYPPELASLLKEFKTTKARLEQYQRQFGENRTRKLLSAIPHSKVVAVVVTAVNALYRTVFTTQAFQTALFLSFFTTMEKYNGDARLEGNHKEKELFAEYLGALNRFFRPQTESETKRLFLAFSGSVSGSFGSESMKIVESDYTLRRIVIQRELKPDEWTKFRYLLLELWKSTDQKLQKIVNEYVAICRVDVLNALYRRDLDRYCRDRGIDPSAVKPKIKEKVSKQAMKEYFDALEGLHGAAIANEEQERLATELANVVTPVSEGEEEGVDSALENSAGASIND
jgi:hypothetical protein